MTRTRAMVRVTACIECSMGSKRSIPLTPVRTHITRLCGQTSTESPHDRQDYDGTAATTEGLALLAVRCPVEPADGRRVAPCDKGRNAEALERPPVGQRRAFRRDDGTAGGRNHRVAGRHVPFASGGEARIDVGGSFG